ncbi:hypothetical protein DQ04_00371160 [Trypanosoma grayi]|uniref:hypothetical protein n=1 Tax=Trypanosoma grayi TaxID=71804 RepID=UPI0004F4665D|nr:hypothetical protein DQ04_00371160 [Trypanosoma grayi]KEG14630.1 hypothetical protein DQ04_00371160 [Trypanosoma grayi]
MSIAPNSIGFGTYLVYVPEPREPMHLSFYFSTPPTMQATSAPQGPPILFLQPQNAAAVQQTPTPFPTELTQSVLTPTNANTFVAANADVGTHLTTVYTQYMVPWNQMQQPIGATLLSPTPSKGSVPNAQFSPGVASVSAQEKWQPSPEGLASPTALSDTVFIPAPSIETKNGGYQSTDIVSVRNFTSPMGSVLEPGLSMRMNVPPLARQRPLRCRIPQGVSTTVSRSDEWPCRK